MKRFLILAILIPTLSNAEEHQDHSTNEERLGVNDLSIGLRSLLSEEMRYLQKGMADIFPLYISGDWEAIAPLARKIENSYVLKQNLSEEQVHELHSKLPVGFIELDQKFHYLSGMLAHAAKMEKPELVGFYFSKMGETCLSCHSLYATERFPKLEPTSNEHAH